MAQLKPGQAGLIAAGDPDALSMYLDTLPSTSAAAPAPAPASASASTSQPARSGTTPLDAYLDELENQPPPKAPPPKAGIVRTIADMGIKGAQGAVDLGQSVVGLASLATGGLAGKGMRAVGYDPAQTNQVLGQYLSPQQQEAEQNVNDAKGFVDSLIAAAKNPRAVAGSVVESLPSMLGIGGVTSAVARRIALSAAAPFGGITTEAGAKAAQEAIDAATNKLLLTSGAAEGGQSAGQIADQAQAEGRDYKDYAGPALASGIATAAITRGAGKIMGNTETALFSGSKTAGVQGSLPARIVKGFVSEGALQEMPQSAQEQVMTNIALGKDDIFDGVGNQAATGLVTGGVMGMGEGAISPHEAANHVRATQTVPEVGPLSAAANVATEGKAQAIENGPPIQTQQDEAPPVDPVLDQIKTLPDGAREEALHAYNIINRPDVPKGVRQYNSKLLDKHLATLDTQPLEAKSGAELLGSQAQDPVQAALRQQQDEETSRQNLSNWMQRAQPMALDRAQGIVAQAAQGGMAMEVVPHAAGQGFTVVPQAWIAPSLRGEVPQNPDTGLLPHDSQPTGVLRADQAGNVAPETGAQRIDSSVAKQAIDEEAQRKAELGLTPDVQAVQAGKKAAPAPTLAPAQARATAPAAAATPATGDILTKSGKPFASWLSASSASRKAGAGHEVVTVAGGFAVRKTDGFTPFPKSTGTLGIPRADMPQIKSENHGPLVNFLNARGVSHEIAEVDPRSLKPTQDSYSEAKAQAVGEAVGDRSILISSDGHVIDGHHQWLHAGAAGEPVKAIRLNAPATELLPLIKEFPSAQTTEERAEGTQAAAVPAGESKAAEVQSATNVAAGADGAAVKPDAALKSTTEGESHVPEENPASHVGASATGSESTVESRSTEKATGKKAADGGAGNQDAGVLKDSATHKDAGQPAEGATAPVIAQSLKKAAAREDRTPAQMKTDLLAQIDAAIGKAPAPREDVGTTEPNKSGGKTQFSGVIGEGEDRIVVAVRQGSDDNWHVADSGLNNLQQARHPIEIFKAAGPAAARAHVEAMMPRLARKDGKLELAPPDMVTFDVPGDGVFKVLNTSARLAEFRKKVEASPGFSSKATPKPDQSRTNGYGMKKEPGSKFGVEKGSEGSLAAVTNMIEEGDFQAALDYATAKRVDLDSLKLTKEDRAKLDAWLKTNPTPTSAEETPAAAPEQPPAAAKPQAEAAQAPEAQKAPADKPASKTEDAGAELEYNKRNRVKSGIDWASIADKNDALKIKETTKQNVYPRPDYQALVDGGMQPMVAHLVKQVYDAISAKPVTRGMPTDDNLKGYIDAVNRVMRGTLEWANDKAALAQWAQRQMKTAGAMMGKSTALSDLTPGGLPGAAQSLLEHVYPEGWRQHQAEVILLGGNKMLSALQPGYDEGRRATKALAEGFPASQEAWQKQGYQVIESSTAKVRESGAKPKTHFVEVGRHYAGGFTSEAEAQAAKEAMKPYLLLDKRGNIKGEFDTKEQAAQAARDAVKRQGKSGPEEAGTTVEDATREGAARRLPGEDISSERLRADFGFKGVNFGNWMKGNTPALNAERQAHLNHAYDAFMDLADILGVPPKAMSLNGMLGMAFGAQGNGKYAAHFVPGLNEINLTRNSGAGSLAHEFGHALDHYFATQAGIAKLTDPFLTEHSAGVDAQGFTKRAGQKVKAFEGIRPEIVAKFNAVVEAMNRKPETIQAFMERAQAQKAKYARNVDGWLKSIKSDFMAAKVPEDKFDALAAKIRALDLGEGTIALGSATHISPVVDELRGLYKDATKRAYSPDQIRGLQANIDALQYATEKKVDESTHVPQQVGTDFAANAAKLDKDKGGKRYWSTNLEKFARAFDAFVSDTLAERAAKNTYLSHAARSDETVPTGTERAAINKAIQGLIDVIDTKETDQGVAMFKRGSLTSTAKGSMQAAEVRQTLSAALDKLKLPYFIHQTIEEASKAVGLDIPDDAKGFHWKGEIHLIGDNLRNPLQAQETFWHEVQHAGLNAALGTGSRAYENALRALSMQNQNIRQAAKAWMVRHGEADYDYRVARGKDPQEAMLRTKLQAVDEALAELAGSKGAKINGLAKFIAKVQDFLHSIGLHELANWLENKTDAQALSMILGSREAVMGRKSEQGSGQLAPAFSKDQAQFSRGEGHKREIQVDGVWHPVENSKGQPIYPTFEGQKAFWQWAGDTKVVDEQGRPIPVYHGTTNDFNAFDLAKAGGNIDSGFLGTGFYFSDDPKVASTYSNMGRTSESTVMPVYLSLKNPYNWGLKTLGVRGEVYGGTNGLPAELRDSVLKRAGFKLDPDAEPDFAAEPRLSKALRAELIERGHDGVIASFRGTGKEYVAFSPNQIKSATGNRGTFDANSDNISFSRTADPRDASTFSDRARDIFNDVAKTQRSFNWWNKTVGSQYQKAEQDSHFKRAFDATQGYILDVSRLANDAADRARDLLPRMENLKDVLKDIPGIDKNATTKADVQALAKPVFQGTLADQREYKANELKQVFKLTDKQIGLYQQFRSAVNKSLDDLTTSTAAKLLRNAGFVEDMIRDELEQGDHEGLAKFAQQAAAADPHLKGLADQVQEISDRAKRLKAEGYAPLMRFGQYAVSVRDPKTGALLEFHLFENNREANAAARQLAGKGMIEQSVMSKEDYKLLKGVSPESLELFGDILEKAGMFDTRDELYQTYLRTAIDQRSAMKRMIQREGYPGYSTDVRRVLATFVTSNARLAAKNLHYSNMLEAVENIPREKGDVKDEAVKLVKYVQEPVEEAPKIRGLLFAQYIGGSVASALTNMTQTLTMTLPYLSQFGNPVKAAAAVAKAMKQATGKLQGDLATDLARAEQMGVVSPQEIHNLNAESMATFGSHQAVQKAMFLWGSLFSLAEQFNRRVAFISAWNTAKALGRADAFDFAVKAVEETQGVYNKGNRPDWARGALGATLFTFKQFSISYLEFLSRLPTREKAMALAILMLSAGAEGMPFADDIDDVIDTIAQRLGYDFNSKQQKRRFIGSMLGEGAAAFLLKGVSSIPGMPIDIAARMGMANLIPGTGMLRKDQQDHMQDVMEFAGPLGSAVQSATRGDFLPTSIKNLVKAADMFQTGQYRDSRGRKVVDTDAVDATWKAVGFQPSEVAKSSLNARLVQQQITLAKQTEADIADDMAQARLDDNAEKYQAARERLRQWNEDNPSSPITISGLQLTRRLREMRASRDQRINKSAPRALRAEVRSELGN